LAEPPKPTYSVGYDDATIEFFRARRGATHAGFLLPQLRSGQRLLDGGCGPGTITLDLAELVAPGMTMGVDVEPGLVALARREALARGASSTRFAAADLCSLPLADGAFDAVFLHGVLEHLPDPVAALAEARRVLARGGVLGARHADFGGFLLEPAAAPLTEFVPLFRALMLRNGGDPEAGRHQPRWLRTAGFARVHVSASYDCWTRTPEDTERSARFLAQLVGHSDFARQAREAGLAGADTLGRMSRAFEAWGRDPCAFAAEAWGEALAWKE
jgi:SAM-dependent methyltransferase